MGRGLLNLSTLLLTLRLGQPTLYAALRTSINLKLFEVLGVDGDVSKNVNSLAASTDSEPILLGQ